MNYLIFKGIEGRVIDQQLNELTHYFRLLMRKAISEYGAKKIDNALSVSQYTLLSTLRSEGQKSCSELAESIRVSLPAVTNLANKLVERKLITRSHGDEDRRSVFLKITSEGLELISRLDKQANEVLNGYWKRLSDVERGQLTALLHKALKADI